jgi:DNA-binding MarR family transcriptional regulator
MGPSLVNAIERATHALGRAIDRKLELLSLDQPGAHVLMRIAADGVVRPNVLADSASRSRSGLTAVLDRLEANGYVLREVDSDDRRAMLVGLTRRGVKAAAAGTVLLASIERRVRKRVSVEDMKAFERVLAIVEEEARRW